MDRKGLEINMSREEVGMDDISKRLVHNKVCNVTVKRNKNKLENALAVIQELVKSGRLHAEGEVETIRTPERLKEYMDHCKQSGEYVLDVETTGLDIYNDILVGICLYTPGETSAYVPFNHTDLQNVRVVDQMSEEQVRDIVIPYLQDQELRCINHNIKFDNKKLAWDWKQIIVNIYWDTLIAGYVLNENEPHGLKPLYNKYILHGKGSSEDYGDLFEGIPFNYVPIEVATVYGANDGFKTYALYKFQAQYLREDHPREDFRKMYYVFREVEMPLIPLCTDMEMRGVEIREDFAKELSEDFNKEMVEVEAKCDAYVEQFKQYILDHNNLMRLTKGMRTVESSILMEL